MRLGIRLARKIHLLIALAIGLHFVLIASTGGLYIFADELTAFALQLRGWKATPGDVGPDRCADAIAAACPEWDRKHLQFPSKKRPFYSGYVPLGSDYFWTDHLVDPGTGRLVGSISNRSTSIEGLLQIAIQLHIHLCAGEIGRRCVDISVTVFLVEILTGLWLWWPGWLRLKRGVIIRRSSKPFLWLYDWHRASGALAAPFLLVMTVTGLLWGFPEVVVPLVYWCCGETAPANVSRDDAQEPSSNAMTSTADISLCSLNEVAEIARLHRNDVVVEGVTLEQDPPRIAKIHWHGANADSIQLLHIDRVTRTILLPEKPQRSSSLADRITKDWAHPLHYGSIGGLSTKLLYLLACAAVDALFVTGLLMWWHKRQKIQRARVHLISEGSLST